MKRRYQLFTIALMALTAASLVTLKTAADDSEVKRGAKVTLQVPLNLFEDDYSAWAGRKLSVEVSPSDDGLIVGGERQWRSVGFPAFLEATVNKVRCNKREGFCDLIFAVEQRPSLSPLLANNKS